MTTLILAALVQIPISGATSPVRDDADDPAIWIDRKNPGRSLILGTNKVKRPTGGIYVWDLNGKELQRVTGIDRPNNIDVEYGLKTPEGTIDIAVAAERLQGRLRVFRVDGAKRRIVDVSGNTNVVMKGVEGFGEPMGITLYKRGDGKIYAIVAPKEGLVDGYLEQYELVARGSKVDAKFVRRFGKFSGSGEIEALVADDELGHLYASDEGYGVRKYHADPDKGDAEIATFARSGVKGDREGLGLYRYPMGSGYLVMSDQREGNSVYHVFRREGNNVKVGEFSVGADETDGLDIVSYGLTEKYFCGIFVAMDSQRKRFVIANWHDIEDKLKLGPVF